MDISVVIVSYNTEALIPQALEALRVASVDMNTQTIIIDNNSRDHSVDLIREEYPDCYLLENNSNVGFGRANNQALPLIQGRYVLLLNTDAFVSPDTLKKTVAYMDAHSSCGLLGVKLVGRDGVLQPSCRYFPTPINMFLKKISLSKLFPWVRMVDNMSWDHASVRACDWVPGCYLLIRREVIDQVGLFDDRYFLYSEEVDLCFSAKKVGWQVHYYGDTTVVHLGGESAKSDNEVTDGGKQVARLQIESELLYFRKNHGIPTIFLHLFLTFLGSFILFLKDVVKLKLLVGAKIFAKQMFAYWDLNKKTKFGAKPTR